MLLRKGAWRERAAIASKEVIPGRVLRVSVSWPNAPGANANQPRHKLDVWAIHNFGLDAEAVRTVTNDLMTNRAQADKEPLSHLVLAAGDLNFHAPGDQAVRPGVSVNDAPPARLPPRKMAECA